MREQTLNLDKYLSNGLRSSDADSINSPYLTALKGARVKDNGIRPVFSPKGIATKQPNLISTTGGVTPFGQTAAGAAGGTGIDSTLSTSTTFKGLQENYLKELIKREQEEMGTTLTFTCLTVAKKLVK